MVFEASTKMKVFLSGIRTHDCSQVLSTLVWITLKLLFSSFFVRIIMHYGFYKICKCNICSSRDFWQTTIHSRKFFEELKESALSMNGSHIVQLHVMISSFEVSHVWFFAEVHTHQFTQWSKRLFYTIWKVRRHALQF